MRCRPATYDGIVRRARSFASCVGHRFSDVTLRLGDSPERVAGATALGRPLVMDGRLRTVVGVMPRGYAHAYDAAVWFPARVDPAVRRTWSLNVVARLAPGVSLENANAELAAISAALAAEIPEGHRNATLVALPLRDTLLGEAAGSLVALFAAIGLGWLEALVPDAIRSVGALGAAPATVLRSVLGRGAVLIGVGLVLGGLGSIALRRVAAGLLAALGPALRALRTDPAEVLRSE